MSLIGLTNSSCEKLKTRAIPYMSEPTGRDSRHPRGTQLSEALCRFPSHHKGRLGGWERRHMALDAGTRTANMTSSCPLKARFLPKKVHQPIIRPLEAAGLEGCTSLGPSLGG